MRKKLMPIVVIMTSLMLFGCFTDDEKTNSMESCIENLENAINNHDYDAFLSCFADSSYYQGSYTQSQFDSNFPSGTTYDFGTPLIVGNTATCSSTKSTGGSTFSNTFTMAEEGDDWYIEKWVEDGSVIWTIPAKK